MVKKIKVSCVAIIGSALQPVAVVVATVSDHNKRRFPVDRKVQYVYMTYEEREALSQLAREFGIGILQASCDGAEGLPVSMRASAFDVETGESIDGESPLRQYGLWSNAEGLWVHAATYWKYADALLASWREAHDDHDPGKIGAPSWLCWTACRKLALAVEATDPALATKQPAKQSSKRDERGQIAAAQG